MEFRYNLNEIFKNVITKVDHNLLPEGFIGDRRKTENVVSQMADIINCMGSASAKAQGLHHPITSAEKMRNCDYTLYLMIDPKDNDGKGSLIGLLKMGVKNLFLFDATGMVHEKKSLCVLDFYVHESKQRTGLGKQMFDFMLEDKDTVPCKLAIDKPSQNFLSFLYKHYGLEKIYPQNNNFVLFEGFFDEKSDATSSLESLEHSHPTETQIEKDVRSGLQTASFKREREDYLPHLYGRHTAFKPEDTMGQIIGEGSTSTQKSPTRNGSSEQEDCSPQLYGQHAASKPQDHVIAAGYRSPGTSRSPPRHGEQEDGSPQLYGRHAAFKLQDHMFAGYGSTSTSKSPTRHGSSEQEDCSPQLYGRHTAFKLQDHIIAGYGSTSTSKSPTRDGEQEDGSPQLYCRHPASKLQDHVIAEYGSTSTSKSPTSDGEQGDCSPQLYGRHAAFKLQDHMIAGYGSTSTSKSPTRNGE